MNSQQRLKLHELIKQNDSVNNTELIRELKHSHQIRKYVEKMEALKALHINDSYEILEQACVKNCYFLYENYTHIFMRLIKNRVDIDVLNTFLDTLQSIEDGKLDQHDASFEIGTLLKKMYVDPRIDESKPLYTPSNNISWQEYKKISTTITK
jgi:hypothetical protein